jgi:8-hydroxy-5-deazaflavin:NADPH oxidoreductase
VPVEQVGRNVGVWKELAAAHRVTDAAARDSMAERFAALGANPTPEDVVEMHRGAHR